MYSKSVIFVLILVSAAVWSCTKEENENPKDALQGTWSSTKVETTGCEDEADNGVAECPLSCITFTVNQENYTKENVIEPDNPQTESGTISVAEGEMILCTSETNCRRLNYELNDGKLTVTYSDDEGCNFVESYIKT